MVMVLRMGHMHDRARPALVFAIDYLVSKHTIPNQLEKSLTSYQYTTHLVRRAQQLHPPLHARPLLALQPLLRLHPYRPGKPVFSVQRQRLLPRLYSTKLLLVRAVVLVQCQFNSVSARESEQGPEKYIHK